MGQELRPYQQQARERIHAEWDAGHTRTLLVLPTGTGKTIVFASVAADQVRAGDRVLILAHRGELLEQAADKLQRSTGLVSAVEKAESTCLDSWFRVVVGSVQTLQRTARLERFPHDYFGTIIIDEAHHAITDGYRRILDYFSGAKVLGVTATPDRGDMRNLGEVFDSLAFEYKLTDAIKEGYLCKIMAQTIPLQLDITSVTMSGGDYAVGDLVELAGVKTAATVLNVNGDGSMLLQAGKMKMTVKAGQVRLLESAEEIEKRKKQATAAQRKNVSPKIQLAARAASELDIRGMETLEAESVVENYIDAAVMAKLGTVTIIHGKGTGALRKAVHEMLKRNRAVKSFRLGRYGEGEAGVTVVELK